MQQRPDPSSAFLSATVVGAGGIARLVAASLARRGLPVAQRTEPGDGAGLVVWVASSPPDLARLESAVGDAAAFVYLTPARARFGTIHEDSPLILEPSRPEDAAALAEAAGEALVLAAEHPQARVLRFADVYTDNLDAGSGLERLIERSLDRPSEPVPVPVDTGFHPVHGADLADAVWAVAARGRRPRYLISEQRVTAAQVLALLAERTGHPLEGLPPAGGEGPRYAPRHLADLDLDPRPFAAGLDRVLTVQDNQRAMRSMLGVSRMPWA